MKGSGVKSQRGWIYHPWRHHRDRIYENQIPGKEPASLKSVVTDTGSEIPRKLFVSSKAQQ
jgi:hypothetical protein